MKRARFGVAVLTVGLGVALAAFAWFLDHLRASARVVPGLGDAAEPEREQGLAVPVSGSDGEDVGRSTDGPARTAVPVMRSPASGLEVHVADEDGHAPSRADVLAYRGSELVRAARTEWNGLARLIPFDGPGTLRVEYNGFELGRLEVEDGHGRFEVAISGATTVAGVVRVDGEPREGIYIDLVSGSDVWLWSWIEYGLESAGFRERHFTCAGSSEPGGTFEFEWLTPDWSGSLRLPGDDYRFQDGTDRLALSRPDDALELDLVPIRPVFEIRGRVVFAGEPVPGAQWQLEGPWGQCDELGRFSIHAREEDLLGGPLVLSKHPVGLRSLELGEPRASLDLGDVELLSGVPLIVRSESGAPIAGALARYATPGPKLRDPPADSRRWSAPTDSSGRVALLGLETGESSILVCARGYTQTEALLRDDPPEPFVIVLPRCASCQVAVRDPSGRVPVGLQVRLEARAAPLAWESGLAPEGDEWTPLSLGRTATRTGALCVAHFPLEERGQAWVEPLRPGERFDLFAVDAFGTILASARGLALAPGEWRRVELRVEAEPRTLLVVVRDSLGRPLHDAKVRVAAEGGPESASVELTTDRAGMARTEPFYGGDLTLHVGRTGFESRTLEHVTVPREGATVEVRLAHDWFSW